MNLYSQITFDDIGGLDSIIRSLKEMIVLPLVYPELFHHYKIKPPRKIKINFNFLFNRKYFKVVFFFMVHRVLVKHLLLVHLLMNVHHLIVV